MRSAWRGTGAAVCAAILAATAGGCRTAPPPVPPGPRLRVRPPAAAADLERMIHGFVNRERAARRLPPLAPDEGLARAARGHSGDMAARGYFGHRSPEGRDFRDRFREAGVACAVSDGRSVRLGAENLALEQLLDPVAAAEGGASPAWLTPEEVAARAVARWMRSPAHRRNLLERCWSREGIGVAVTPDGAVYVTQALC